jgi:septal ring factor EnvC (AmiA/AmiB activator)
MKNKRIVVIALLSAFVGLLISMSPQTSAASVVKKIDKKITVAEIKADKRKIGNDQDLIKKLTTEIMNDQSMVKMDTPNSAALAKDKKKLAKDQKAFQKAQQSLAKHQAALAQDEKDLEQTK